MKNNTKAHFMIAAICFLLGMLLVAQFRSVQTAGNATSIQRARNFQRS